MRAIDADALKEIIENSYEVTWNHDYNGGFKDACVSILDEIDSAPTIEPIIIRCKNCKHWREGDAYSYCQKLFNFGVLDVYDYMRAEEDFCSLAERRKK